jgi:hypothetical protein
MFYLWHAVCWLHIESYQFTTWSLKNFAALHSHSLTAQSPDQTPHKVCFLLLILYYWPLSTWTSNPLLLTSIYMIQAVFLGRNSPNTCKCVQDKWGFNLLKQHPDMLASWMDDLHSTRGVHRVHECQEPYLNQPEKINVLFLSILLYLLNVITPTPDHNHNVPLSCVSLLHHPPHMLPHPTTTTPPPAILTCFLTHNDSDDIPAHLWPLVPAPHSLTQWWQMTEERCLVCISY